MKWLRKSTPTDTTPIKPKAECDHDWRIKPRGDELLTHAERELLTQPEVDGGWQEVKFDLVHGRATVGKVKFIRWLVCAKCHEPKLERVVRNEAETWAKASDEPEIGSITCPKCHRTSYNPNDIRFKFCAACDEYHDGMKRELGDHADELWKPGEKP